MKDSRVSIVNYQRTNVRPLLRLTERLFKLDFFSPYLTYHQLIVLENFLSIEDESTKIRVWQELLKGNLRLDVVEVASTEETETGDVSKTVDESLKDTGEVSRELDLKDDILKDDNLEDADSKNSNAKDSTSKDSDLRENDLKDGDSNDKDREGIIEVAQQTKKEDEIDDDFSQLDLEDFKQQIIGKDFVGNLSLKLRYVIWQCALDYMYKDETVDSIGGDDESFGYILLEEDVELEEVGSKELDNGPKTMSDDDDDNYDDDDDDDENYDENEKEEDSSSSTRNLEVVDEEGGDHLTVRLKISKDVLTKLRNDNNEQILKNSNRIYHSFEHDKENMLKRLRLEENDKLLDGNGKKRTRGDSEESASGPEPTDSTQDSSAAFSPSYALENSQGMGGKRPKHDPMSLPVNLGAAHLSLKHLLASIQENKPKLKLSDYELKHLIMDVRKNRSKWASDEKIGQEELYEACEKVVLELRNYTEHSTPFLNKVSKREAPNYHLIIKKSMDLNTVLKKLKTFQYESKQSFVDDIMLIWKNCLTYNSDPSHFLRGHAIAMQKKSLQLIPLIPDIVIRNRADVEKELEEMDKDKDCEEEEEEVAGSGRKGLNMGAHMPAKPHDVDKLNSNDGKGPGVIDKEQQSEREGAVKGEITKIEDTKLTEMENTDSGKISEETEKATGAENHLSAEQQPVQENKEEEEDEDEELADSQSFVVEKDDDKDDAEISVWKSLTAKVRAEICLKRSICFEKGKLNANSKALIKDPQRLKTFEQLYAEHEEQKEIELQRERLEKQSVMKNGFQTMVKQEEDDQSSFSTEHPTENADSFQKESDEMEIDATTFLKEYDSVNCLPAIVYSGVDAKLQDREEDACVKRILEEEINKPSVFMANRDRGMTPKMNKNIGLIQQIRHICHKISLIRLLQSSSGTQNARSNPNQFISSHQYKYETIDDTLDIDPISQLRTHDCRSNKQLIWRFMHKNVSKISMSNGFETAQPSAINTLTELAGDYLSNLIKSVKTHHESNSLSRAGSKEILQMSLLENGISRPDDLFIYYESEFSKKTRKLLDVKSKLEGFLKELLRPTLQELSERNFDDESQSFLTGDFATEITGEDFFGFKELGLEKEFGVLSSSVPLQLLTFQLQANDGKAKEQTKKLQPEEFGNVVYTKITKEGIMEQSRWATFLSLLDMANERSKNYRQKVAKSNAAADQLTSQAIELIESQALLEDDEMTFKAKTGRPRLPPTGKISSAYKKKPTADAFILPDDEEETTNGTEVKNGTEGGVFYGTPSTANDVTSAMSLQSQTPVSNVEDLF